MFKGDFRDPAEVLRLEREDVQGNIVTINHPVNGICPGRLKCSAVLVCILNPLPNKGKRYFTYSSRGTLWSCCAHVQRRAAELQKNPRLLHVELRSFRHWGGTMLAHYTNGNVLTVKKLLGHKRVENTMKYIGMLHFKDDEFEVTATTTVEEDKQALTAGFQYVTERNGVKLWRRMKRFGHSDDKRRIDMISLK